jgi:hypothetical protein
LKNFFRYDLPIPKDSVEDEEVVASGSGKECVLNVECSDVEKCIQNKCINPCSHDICGQNADCTVKKHNPICSCKKGYEGDPFVTCKKSVKVTDCVENVCGKNADCKLVNDEPVCACQSGFEGNPLKECVAK